MGRNLLSIYDLTKEEIESIISRGIELKDKLKAGVPHKTLDGKTIGLLFEKHSTRTRVSFEVAILQLGGHAIFLTPDTTQIVRGEPVKDTARVLARYLDAIVIRTHAHKKVEEFAAHSSVPVINGLSDLLHPCQILSDLMTIKEKKGDIKDLKVSYIGDGNNVANSWINASAKAGFRLALACPSGYKPNKDIIFKLTKEEKKRITIVDEPEKAVKDADVLYTDVWVSMGQEEEKKEKTEVFQKYRIDRKILDSAKPDAIVMHCLPAHRGEEITDEIMEGKNSVIFDQAENRLHTQKAILECAILDEKGKELNGKTIRIPAGFG